MNFGTPRNNVVIYHKSWCNYKNVERYAFCVGLNTYLYFATVFITQSSLIGYVIGYVQQVKKYLSNTASVASNCTVNFIKSYQASNNIDSITGNIMDKK